MSYRLNDNFVSGILNRIGQMRQPTSAAPEPFDQAQTEQPIPNETQETLTNPYAEGWDSVIPKTEAYTPGQYSQQAAVPTPTPSNPTPAPFDYNTMQPQNDSELLFKNITTAPVIGPFLQGAGGLLNQAGGAINQFLGDTAMPALSDYITKNPEGQNIAAIGGFVGGAGNAIGSGLINTPVIGDALKGAWGTLQGYQEHIGDPVSGIVMQQQKENPLATGLQAMGFDPNSALMAESVLFGRTRLEDVVRNPAEAYAKAITNERIKPPEAAKQTALEAEGLFKNGDFVGAASKTIEMLEKWGHAEFNEATPVEQLMGGLLYDPLNFVGLEFLGGIGKSQKFMRAARATAAVDDLETAMKDAPFLAKVAQKVFNIIPEAEKGKVLPLEKLGVAAEAESHRVRYVNPPGLFKQSPLSKGLDATKRMQDYVINLASVGDIGRNKFKKIIGLMGKGAAKGEIPETMRKVLEAHGITNSVNAQLVMHAAKNFVVSPELDEAYDAATMLANGLAKWGTEAVPDAAKMQRHLGDAVDLGDAIAKLKGKKNLSESYQGAFNRFKKITDEYNVGKRTAKDVNNAARQLTRDVETLGKLQIGTDLADNLQRVIQDFSKIPGPNFYERFVNKIRPYESLLFIATNPHAISVNAIGNWVFLALHGANPFESINDIRSLFGRAYGIDDTKHIIGNVGDVLTAISRNPSTHPNAPMGTAIPSALANNPLGKLWKKAEEGGQIRAYAKGFTSTYKQLWKYGSEIPSMPAPLEKALRASMGDKMFRRFTSATEDAYNDTELYSAVDDFFKQPKWTEYADQIASKLSEKWSQRLGKPVTISAEELQHLVSDGTSQAINSHLSKIADQVLAGVDVETASRNAAREMAEQVAEHWGDSLDDIEKYRDNAGLRTSQTEKIADDILGDGGTLNQEVEIPAIITDASTIAKWPMLSRAERKRAMAQHLEDSVTSRMPTRRAAKKLLQETKFKKPPQVDFIDPTIAKRWDKLSDAEKLYHTDNAVKMQEFLQSDNALRSSQEASEISDVKYLQQTVIPKRDTTFITDALNKARVKGVDKMDNLAAIQKAAEKDLPIYTNVNGFIPNLKEVMSLAIGRGIKVEYKGKKFDYNIANVVRNWRPSGMPDPTYEILTSKGVKTRGINIEMFNKSPEFRVMLWNTLVDYIPQEKRTYSTKITRGEFNEQLRQFMRKFTDEEVESTIVINDLFAKTIANDKNISLDDAYAKVFAKTQPGKGPKGSLKQIDVRGDPRLAGTKAVKRQFKLSKNDLPDINRIARETGVREIGEDDLSGLEFIVKGAVDNGWNLGGDKDSGKFFMLVYDELSSEQPVPLYHGTASLGFDKFDKSKQDVNALYGPGIYMTEDPALGSSYTSKGLTNPPLNRDITSEDVEKLRRLVSETKTKYGYPEPYRAANGVFGQTEHNRIADMWREADARYVKDHPAYQDTHVGWLDDLSNIFEISDSAPDTFTEKEIIAAVDDTLSSPLLPPWEADELYPLLGVDIAPDSSRQGVIQGFMNTQKPFNVDEPVTDETIKAITDVFIMKPLASRGSGRAYRPYEFMKDLKAFARSDTPTNDDLYKFLNEKYLSKSSVNDKLREAGFDSITHIGGKGRKEHRVWIALNENQIVNGLSGKLMQEVEDGGSWYYSSVLRAVESLPDNVNAGDLWRESKRWTEKIKVKDKKTKKLIDKEVERVQYGGLLAKQEFGIKPSEMKWIGLDDFITKNPKATKQEIVDFVKVNQVEVREVRRADNRVVKNPEWITSPEVNGRRTHESTDGRFTIEEINDKLFVLKDKSGKVKEYAPSLYEAQRNAFYIVDKENDVKKTRWSQYQLPGGTNYREVQLVLGGEILDDTNHYNTPNQIMHLRLNDRIDADGKKVLFVEESQSDWGQGLRDFGEVEKEKLSRLQKEKDKWQSEFDQLLENDAEYQKLVQERDALSARMADISVSGNDINLKRAIKKNQSKVEIHLSKVYGDYEQNIRRLEAEIDNMGTGRMPGPFVENTQQWTELGIKRVLRMAAEGDYDVVAWTTGLQQTERWSNELRGIADNIKWSKIEAAATAKQALSRRRIDLKGEKFSERLYINDAGIIVEGQFTGHRLSELIGDEVAEKIISTDSGNLIGEQIGVGGQGFIEYYDNIMRRSFENVGKKWDVKSVDSKIFTRKSKYNIREAPEPRHSTYNEQTGNYEFAPERNVFYATDEGVSPYQNEPYFYTREEAREWIDKNYREKAETVHSIDITKEMRESVLRDKLPLFQTTNKGGKSEAGSTFFTKDGRAVIKLVEDNANISTVVEELAHAYRPHLPAEMQEVIAQYTGVPSARFQELQSKVNADKYTPSEWNEYKKDQEAFAKGLLQYMREGKAPTPELANVFERFAKWFKEVLDYVVGMKDVKLTDEMRQLYDSILSANKLNKFAGPAVKRDYSKVIELAREMGLVRKRDKGGKFTLTLFNRLAKFQHKIIPGAGNVAEGAPRIFKTEKDIEAHIDEVYDFLLEGAGYPGSAIAKKSGEIIDVAPNITDNTVPPIQNRMPEVGTGTPEGDFGDLMPPMDKPAQSLLLTSAPTDTGFVKNKKTGKYTYTIPVKPKETNRVIPPDAFDGWWGDVDPYDKSRTEYYQMMQQQMVQDMLDELNPLLKSEQFAQNPMPDQLRSQVNGWLKSKVLPSQLQTKQAATAVGRWYQGHTLLNYDQRWNIDDLMGMGQPFMFWPLHTAVNTGQEILDRPRILNGYMRLRDSYYNWSESQTSGMPERFKGRIRIPVPGLPEYMQGGVWINPFRTILPIEDLYQMQALEKASHETLNSIDNEADPPAPETIFNDIMSPHVPLKLMMQLLGQDTEGVQDTIANLPPVRMAKALGLMGLDSPEIAGIKPFKSKWDSYYVERALRDMLAEKKITEPAFRQALLERSGVTWKDAMERARIQNYTMSVVPGFTGFTGKVYTQGEQIYNSARLERDRLVETLLKEHGASPNLTTEQKYEFLRTVGELGQKPDGTMGRLSQLYQARPELVGSLIRSNRNAEEDEKLYRSWLTDSIWDRVTNAKDLELKLWRAQLGTSFDEYFYKKQNRDYDKIPTDQLAGWGIALKVGIPKPSDSNGFVPPNPQPYQVSFPTEAQNEAYQDHQAQIEEFVGWDNYYAAVNQYYTLKDKDEESAKDFLDTPEGKAMQAVWDFESEFYGENTSIRKMLEAAGVRESKESNGGGVPGSDEQKKFAWFQGMLAAGYKEYDEYKAERDGYFALPSGKPRQEYSNVHPRLLRVFGLNNSIYDTDAEITQSRTKSFTKKDIGPKITKPNMPKPTARLKGLPQTIDWNNLQPILQEFASLPPGSPAREEMLNTYPELRSYIKMGKPPAMDTTYYSIVSGRLNYQPKEYTKIK